MERYFGINRRGAAAAAAGAIGLTWSALTAGAATVPILTRTTPSNVTTTLVADDFESPAAPANPVADVGTWVVSEAGTGTVNSTTARAFEGNQSVEIKRPDGTSALLGSNFGAQANGNTLDFRFMVYVVEPVGVAMPNILLADTVGTSGSTSLVSITPLATVQGGAVDTIRLIVGNASSTPKFSSALFRAFETNTWQEWRILHTVGTNTATFTIDGVSDTHTGAVPASIGALQFTGGTNGSETFYIDAVPVPEPSALGALGLSALVLARRRRATV